MCAPRKHMHCMHQRVAPRWLGWVANRVFFSLLVSVLRCRWAEKGDSATAVSPPSVDTSLSVCNASIGPRPFVPEDRGVYSRVSSLSHRGLSRPPILSSIWATCEGEARGDGGGGSTHCPGFPWADAPARTHAHRALRAAAPPAQALRPTLHCDASFRPVQQLRVLCRTEAVAAAPELPAPKQTVGGGRGKVLTWARDAHPRDCHLLLAHVAVYAQQ